MYMMIDIYGQSASGNQYLVHSVIVTAEEAAEHLKDYRGYHHVITGFMTADEVTGLSYIDRGLAYLEEKVG